MNGKIFFVNKNFICKKLWNNFYSAILLSKESYILLLLLLSRFSRVRLSATPEMAAHQAPLSLGFTRQGHWLPFPSPVHESEKWKWSHSVVSDSSYPMDCSLPGSSIHGIFQAKVLEWGAIAFSLRTWIIFLKKSWCTCTRPPTFSSFYIESAFNGLM